GVDADCKTGIAESLNHARVAKKISFLRADQQANFDRLPRRFYRINECIKFLLILAVSADDNPRNRYKQQEDTDKYSCFSTTLPRAFGTTSHRTIARHSFILWPIFTGQSHKPERIGNSSPKGQPNFTMGEPNRPPHSVRCYRWS